MELFNFYIDHEIYHFLNELLKKCENSNSFNNIILENYNFYNFIQNESDFKILKLEFSKQKKNTLFDNKIEYGDFQTPNNLSDRICQLLYDNGVNPDIIIEPTCGAGNFLISSLKTFKDVKTIIGIEINSNYVWQTKIRLLSLKFHNEINNEVVIKIINKNIFDYPFQTLEINDDNILVIGNPPWVTNTILTSLDSNNIPEKSNFKNHNGIDAITGKGNFDISEYISLNIIKYFQLKKGTFAFLLKNSVVNNLMFDQYLNKFKISNIRKYNINAQKEFNVAVDACLFTCDFKNEADFNIQEYSFDSEKHIKTSGWVGDKFVSHVNIYNNNKNIEGKSQFEWRSGIKHDCSSVLELMKINGKYKNKLGESYELEDNLVYSYLKGSYLKDDLINSSKLFTIVTQKNVSQNTDYIKNHLQLTYKYLTDHKEYFEKRKSTIYKGKPEYSIFGIGDYSFKPYKIAIAALYKKYSVSLIVPDETGKPIMLDDTCYFIGFNDLITSLYIYTILNHDIIKEFIESIAFNDVKRKFNKELLMRIDLLKAIQYINFNDIMKIINENIPDYQNSIDDKTWETFISNLSGNILLE